MLIVDKPEIPVDVCAEMNILNVYDDEKKKYRRITVKRDEVTGILSVKLAGKTLVYALADTSQYGVLLLQENRVDGKSIYTTQGGKSLFVEDGFAGVYKFSFRKNNNDYMKVNITHVMKIINQTGRFRGFIVGNKVNSYHFFNGWRLAQECELYSENEVYSLRSNFMHYLNSELGNGAAWFVFI